MKAGVRARGEGTISLKPKRMRSHSLPYKSLEPISILTSPSFPGTPILHFSSLSIPQTSNSKIQTQFTSSSSQSASQISTITSSSSHHDQSRTTIIPLPPSSPFRSSFHQVLNLSLLYSDSSISSCCSSLISISVRFFWGGSLYDIWSVRFCARASFLFLLI